MLLDLLPLQHAAAAPPAVRGAPTAGNALGTFYVQAVELCVCDKNGPKKCPVHCKKFVERQHAEDDIVLLSL